MMKDLQIKKSKISGKGVFANRNFLKGEVVINYPNCSEVLGEKQFQKLSPYQKKYVSSFNEGEYTFFKSPARFVNHSCEPNIKSNGKSDIAIRDIKINEEVTSNYQGENVPGLNFKCRCGARDCRGLIKS